MHHKLKNTRRFINEENLFIICGLVFGLLFIYINPPYHSNDEDRHFIHAYLISQGNIIPESRDGKPGGMLPVNLIETIKSYQGIPFYNGAKIDKKKTKQFDYLQLNSKNKIFTIDYQYKANPLPYLPHSFGIFIVRLAGANPVWLGYAGRISGLLVYIALIFAAIKLAPIFKSVFMFVGLMPMSLYQGASVTYDMMSNGITILLISYILYLAFSQNEKLSIKSILLFALTASVHRFSKDGYYLLPFLFFLIPYKKIGSPLKVGLIAAYMILLIFLPDLTWGKIISGVDASGIGLLKKDFYENAAMNLEIALSNPFEFISAIVSNFLHFRQEWIGGMIARFGYSYTMMPDWFYIIYGLIIIMISFFDGKNTLSNVNSTNEKSKQNEFNFAQKIYIFIVGFGTAFLVIVGLYLHSPVGAKMIFGLQGRYFIPSLPIILLLLYNTKFTLGRHQYLLKYISALISSLSLIYCLITLSSALYAD